MDIILSLSSLWAILNEGPFGAIWTIVTLTIPQLVLYSFGYSSINEPNIPENVIDIYNNVYNFFSVVKFGDEPNITSLADISLFSVMFGFGLVFILIYSLVKWIVGLVK